jgi:hypothetical protein
MSIHKRTRAVATSQVGIGGRAIAFARIGFLRSMKRTREVDAPPISGRGTETGVRMHKMRSETATHSENAQPRIQKANPAHIPPVDSQRSAQSNQKNTSSTSPSSGAKARSSTILQPRRPDRPLPGSCHHPLLLKPVARRPPRLDEASEPAVAAWCAGSLPARQMLRPMS